jgi:hypothetical protein
MFLKTGHWYLGPLLHSEPAVAVLHPLNRVTSEIVKISPNVYFSTLIHITFSAEKRTKISTLSVILEKNCPEKAISH